MSAYDIVTARILEALERGVAPWRKPWNGPQAMPHSLSSLKPYRGVNAFMLSLAEYESPFWLTFNQAKELHGHVRKGEHGWPVVFWKEWQTTDKQSGEMVEIPLLRYYTVFNTAQVEGI